MPSFSALNDSVRCCCRTRRSCWMYVIIHSVLSMIRAVLLYVLDLWGFGGGSKCARFEPPGTWYWSCYGLANTAPNRSIHTPNVQEIHSFMLAFFSVVSTRIFCAFLCQSPFCNSYPGSHGTYSSPFPTTVRAFVLIARKIYVQN